jgi:hypothetical protein
VFLFQFVEELFSGIAAPVTRKSCVEHDFRIYVNCGGEPHVLFVLSTIVSWNNSTPRDAKIYYGLTADSISFELDLFLIDSDAI